MYKYQHALKDFLSLKEDFKDSDAYEVLEVIANRNTPKKPNDILTKYIRESDTIILSGECDTCKHIVFDHQFFCEKCGQFIDWRVEDQL